jgi:hypothetical protein
MPCRAAEVRAIDDDLLLGIERVKSMFQSLEMEGRLVVIVLCSWQLLSYAKATVTRQKEYACEQLNRATLIVSAMPYPSLD